MRHKLFAISTNMEDYYLFNKIIFKIVCFIFKCDFINYICIPNSLIIHSNICSNSCLETCIKLIPENLPIKGIE